MNKIKSYSVAIIFSLILTIVFCMTELNKKDISAPNEVYQIYLDGEKIGLIENKEEFYELINKEQVDIKNQYNVDQVYPPKGFEIIDYLTYNEKTTASEEIYDSIKNERDFTIKGYTITVKTTVEEDEEQEIYTINVLDENIFTEAMERYITTFIELEQYENFTSNSQEELTDVGQIIEDMYFNNIITVKENYINASEKIYTDSIDLVQKLLYGDDIESEEYKVKTGDTIESIAFDNKLNVEELLIANPSIKSENSILAIGQSLNIALIKPQLELIYDLEVKEVIEEAYQTEIVYDNTKYVGYKEVTTEGVPGLLKITKYVRAVNGVMNQDAEIEADLTETIRPVQNEVIVYGSKVTTGGSYVDTGAVWGHPTNFPYVITSAYGYRGGVLHDGIDISGTGYGSPIYATLDGEVINAGWGGYLGNNAGYNVVIKHVLGSYTYYSAYAHLSAINVRVGQIVTKGSVIAAMGNSGYSSGYHLHFGIYDGLPYNGGVSINPSTVIRF